MDNPTYNSLADKLKQSGILTDNTTSPFKEENVFLKGMTDSENDYIEDNPTNEEIETPVSQKANKKRINHYDLELIEGGENIVHDPVSPFYILKRFLNFKNNTKLSPLESFCNRFFPRLYKIKIAKDAVKRLSELDIDTKMLLDKAIPYGEAELRYNNLVKYLKYANEIQLRLNKKI